MIRSIFFIILLLMTGSIWAQLKSSEIIDVTMKHRKETDEEFRNAEESPLPIFRADEFIGLPYFEIDTNYYVQARFVKSEGGRPFKMKTSTDRIAEYNVFGLAYFVINGDSVNLTLYESITKEEGDGHLFLPFLDETNGNETYSAGRYVGVDYPKGDTLFINFNKAYNPYCAYSNRYSCPLVPRENRLPVSINAGVKYEKHAENWGELDKQPAYPGGPQKLYANLFGQLTYPREAKQKKLEGTVYIGLLIDQKGVIVKREILQGFDEQCNEAALKATNALGTFQPAMKDGKPVRERIVLPVGFKL